MIQESKIVHQTRIDFFKVEEEHVNHIRRLKVAIKWFNDNLIAMHEDGVCGSVISYEGVKCVVAHFDFRTSPYFNALFDIRPMWSGDDIGCGAGLIKHIKF